MVWLSVRGQWNDIFEHCGKWLYTLNSMLSQTTNQGWIPNKNVWVWYIFGFVFQGLKISPPKSSMWKSLLKKPAASETSGKQAWK